MAEETIGALKEQLQLRDLEIAELKLRLEEKDRLLRDKVFSENHSDSSQIPTSSGRFRSFSQDSNTTIEGNPTLDEWEGIETMIDSFLELNGQSSNPQPNPQPFRKRNISSETMESIDGYMLPRRLHRIVKTASVEIERLVEEDEDMEEEDDEMGGEMEEAEEAEGRQSGDGEEAGEGEDAEEVEEIQLEQAAPVINILQEGPPQSSEHSDTPGDSPVPEIRVPSAGELSPNLKRPARRVSSRPASQFNSKYQGQSRGSSRRSSSSGLLPPWLVYHWISPKPAVFSPATLAILGVCQVPTSVVEVMVVDKMALSLAACNAIPSQESEELTKHLLRVFEAGKLSVPLIEEMVKAEIATTQTHTTLFRSNTITSKLLSFYSRMAGKQYLQHVLGGYLKNFKNFGNLEVDPEKASDDEVRNNMPRLLAATADLMNYIFASIEHCPHSFRKLCQVINERTNEKFPGRGLIAVGGFIFLRFFCPALVAPEAFALFKKAPTNAERRALVLVSKVVQSLANGVKFGTKEHFLTPVNDFLDQFTNPLNKYLKLLATVPNPLTIASITIPAAMIEESIVRLTSIFEDHLTKIEEILGEGLVAEQITHSMSDNMNLILRDFPLNDEAVLSDMVLMNRFETLLLSENFSVLKSLLMVVSTSSKDSELLAKAAIQILIPKNLALSFISLSLQHELLVSSSSKVVDSFPLTFRLSAALLNQLGGSYLKKILKDVVTEICTSTRGYEVDPHYLPFGESLPRNMDSLIMASYKITACIINSFESCPPTIRRLCHEAYQQIAAKRDKAVALSTVTQILFLRFICPAIASPEAYSLVDQPPSKKAHRALVLISYCLKHLACGTIFKDLHMVDMNSFIRDHSQLLQEFIVKVADYDLSGQPIAFDPAISPEQRAQCLVNIRSLLVKDHLSRLTTLFDNNAVTEVVSYKLINRLATVLADKYKKKD